jgi:trans-aconitate methyltransferase
VPTNEWNPALYNRKHAYVFEYGREVIELLGPRPGERILDLGCGTGHLTSLIAASGASVIGLDSSPAMVEAARREYPEIEFVVGDARNFSFSQPFDAVFSNATLHWVNEAAEVARSVSPALSAGGRFVAEFGGKGNVGRIVRALAATLAERGRQVDFSEWYNPSLGEYAALLEAHGLAVTFAALFDRPTKLEDGDQGLRLWLEMFRGGAFADFSEAEKDAVMRAVEDKLRTELYRDGDWYADYRRLRVVAIKAG